MSTVLVTGFEAYGGRSRNPSALVAERLDGERIGGVAVTGRVLPVVYAELASAVRALVREHDPVAVVGCGLWPGEPTIRLERFAVNVADFEIADNTGALVSDTVFAGAAVQARPSRLPLRAIEQALLSAGIPARLSSTAGTFLCNAAMYHFLDSCAAEVPCGFVHLPYLPEQVAELLRDLRSRRALEAHQRADLASMSAETIERSVRIAVETTVSEIERAGKAA